MESPATIKQLTKARQRNEVLSERLSNQNQQCKHLEEQIRKSDEHSCNLQHKVIKGGNETHFSTKSYLSMRFQVHIHMNY